MSRRLHTGIVLAALAALATGCGGGDQAQEEPTTSKSAGASSTTLTSGDTPATASPAAMPCDPGMGFPQPSATCPVEEPTVALLTSYAADGALTLQPLRVLTNGPEGKAWAEEHGVEYPFPNDYYQVPDGAPKSVQVADSTVCTGVILVGYEEPLADHVVDCAAFRTALDQLGEITVAVWTGADGLVQLSELYRP